MPSDIIIWKLVAIFVAFAVIVPTFHSLSARARIQGWGRALSGSARDVGGCVLTGLRFLAVLAAALLALFLFIALIKWMWEMA